MSSTSAAAEPPRWVAGLLDSRSGAPAFYPCPGLRALLAELLHGDGAQLVTTLTRPDGTPDLDRVAVTTLLQLDGSVLVQIDERSLAAPDWPAAFAVHRTALGIAGERLSAYGRSVATTLTSIRGLAMCALPALASPSPLGSRVAATVCAWWGFSPETAPLLATGLHVLAQAVMPMAAGFVLARLAGPWLVRGLLRLGMWWVRR